MPFGGSVQHFVRIGLLGGSGDPDALPEYLQNDDHGD
tara:strand:- start:2882 stop:2992 length:111 start_codon:yes stop_codon:yes gene_type:complete